VVFDGRAPAGGEVTTHRHRVSVRYSESRSADDVILGLVGASKAPRDYIVVTSDKSLGDKARHRGALVERTHEFSRRLQRTQEKTRDPEGRPVAKETPEQIDAWLAVFDPARR
jgi:predicted RNA-binding protein with PIN domain